MIRVVPRAALLAAAVLVPWTSLAAGPPRESPDAVRSAILAALQPADAAAARVDPGAAAAMPRCGGALSVSFMGGGAYRTAQVACPAPHWTLYVQVAVQAMESVLVATRALQMGQAIGNDDFRVVRMPANDVAGAPITAAQAAGVAAASPISVGQTITRQNVIIPLAVHNGQRVVVHISMPGADATVTGIALQSGGIGQSILVANDTSHKRITAVIAGSQAPPPAGQAFILAN